MGTLAKNHYFHIRGIKRALKNRVKSAARKDGSSVEGLLRALIEKTYPEPTEKKK